METLVKFKADIHLCDALMTATHTNVASKAFHSAGRKYLESRDEVFRLRAEIERLHMRLRVQQQVIDRARDSAAALLDHVAQGDLLSS